jgi:hypothetical protein
MKRTLILLVCLLVTRSIAWAEDPTPDAEVVADPGPGGACALPDLAGLSPDQIAAAVLEAGLQIQGSPAAAPLCPTTFKCNSIANCAAGPLCSLTNIGPCCTTPGGLSICCVGGLNIWVKRCPCQCTAPACSFQCVNSTEVSRFCA